MITKMKKVLLFTTDKAEEVDVNLTLLGELGVVHITPFQAARSEMIEHESKKINKLEEAISTLDKIDGSLYEEAVSADTTDYNSLKGGDAVLMSAVLDQKNTRIELENLKQEYTRAIEWYRHWGKVTTKDINEIAESGVSIKLYLLENRDLKSLKENKNVRVIGKIGELNQVVLIMNASDKTLNFDEIKPPKYDYEGLESSLADINEKIYKINKSLSQLKIHKTLLEDALKERKRRYEILNVQFAGSTIEDKVRFWKGFMPDYCVDDFIKVAEKHKWGYVIEDPSEEDIDSVPTLIKSPRWVERIKPVMKFMGLVPGYKEMDVSRVFMLFFTFFAGILVGDAGYGLVFLILTFLVHRKQKFVRKIEFGLFYTLSASVMIWGILTGTYFGSETIAQIPLFTQLKINKLASFGGSNDYVQKVMFLIGAIHLSIGHLQLAWKYINSVKAIAQIGWVAIIWGLYFLVAQMVLVIPPPAIMVWLFIGGSLLIAMFSNPGKNFLSGVLASLGSLPLSIINGFSDIISYIRLYAVGLATVLMAVSFNQMAIGDGVTTLVSGIGAAIVLILGHTLNMILAGMAVIVHGVRLNMLEYSGHADVEFSGTDYNPFKLNKSISNK